jgi:hypothetical protein
MTNGPKEYLILARYTAQSWLRWRSFSKLQRDEARNQARLWFPIKDPKVVPPTEPSFIDKGGSVYIPEVGTIRLLRTFRTTMIDRIDEIKEAAVERKKTKEAKDSYDKYIGEAAPAPEKDPYDDYAESTDPEIMEELLSGFAALYANVPQKPYQDPGIGWVAIVDEAQCVNLLGTYWMKPFWQLFEVEVIPLNFDLSTQDIYIHMTPTNWRT